MIPLLPALLDTPDQQIKTQTNLSKSPFPYNIQTYHEDQILYCGPISDANPYIFIL